MFFNLETVARRIEWIDVAKGIGILLVVLGHTLPPGLLNNWLCMFHMPFFFMLSGFCYNESKYEFRELFVKRTKTLLFPALIFSLVIFFICFIVHLDLCNFALGLPGGLWFLEILFIVESLYWFIGKFQYSSRIIIVLVFSLLPLCINEYVETTLYSLKTVPTALFYYGLGNICRLYLDKDNQLKTGLLLVLSIVYLLLPLLYVWNINGSMHLISNSIPEPYFLSICVSIIGALGLVFLSCLIAREMAHQYLVVIGKNSLTILGLHMILLEMCTSYVKPLFTVPILYILTKVMLVTIVIVFCAKLINSRAPWMLGKF